MTIRYYSAAFLFLGLASCSLQKSTTSAPPTAFLVATGANTSGKIGRLPFDHSWKNEAVNISKYSHIAIRQVSTAYLHKEQWKDSYSADITSSASYVKHCNELASYFSSALKRSFSGPGGRLALTDSSSGPNTLILEVALSEVTFGRPEGYVGAMAVPGGSIVNAAAASPMVAFEARIKDSATGKVIATISDRRGTRFKIVDFNQLTYTKANEEICGEWSQHLMQAANKELFPKVKRTWFTPF